jgi:predicted amidohydrolase
MYTAMSPFCDVVLNLANWPSVRSNHWQTLLRARAIENQLFLIGVNRYGLDKEGTFFAGDSMIYDPWGDLVHPEFTRDHLSVYSLNLDLVSSVRNSFPVSRDRRFKVSLI